MQIVEMDKDGARNVEEHKEKRNYLVILKWKVIDRVDAGGIHQQFNQLFIHVINMNNKQLVKLLMNAPE